MTATHTPEDVGRYYDQVTALFSAALEDNLHLGYWPDAQDDSSPAEAAERLTDLVGERLGLVAGQHVLDVGCGTGKPAARLATGNDVRVTGITVSEEQLRQAQRRADPDRLAFRLADAMRLPFADAEFDAAYAIESLLHMSDQPAALAHIARVVKPRGRLVIVDFCLMAALSDEDAATIATTAQAVSAAPTPSAEQFRDLVTDAGFVIDEMIDISSQTRRSYTLIAELMRNAAGNVEEGLAAQLVGAADSIERFAVIKELGYFLMSATRV